jgi:hypothetical protein
VQDQVELANLIRKLPVGVAHSVAFVLADSLALPKQTRGARVLELAECFPAHGVELRSLALRCGFDPSHHIARARLLPRAV